MFMESKKTQSYMLGLISGNGEVNFEEVSLPEVNPDQVLVKIHYCAICTLEQRIYSGVLPRYPFAGGHEISGVVESIGENVTSVNTGDKVAVRLLTSCGECYYCRAGNENQCEVSFKASMHEGFNGPGGFAEYMLTSAQSVYKLNDSVDLVHAALTEPLACCVHSIGNAEIGMGDDVVVIGAGIMGMFHIQLAKLRGARVIVCEVDNARLELAATMGADVTINSSTENAVERVKALTEGRGAHAVFCTAAIAKLAQESIDMAGKLGRVVLYSSFHPNLPVEIDVNKIHSYETIITGSVNPCRRDFLTAVRLLSYNLIDVSRLISDVLPLEEMDSALKLAMKPETYRVILDCIN